MGKVKISKLKQTLKIRYYIIFAVFLFSKNMLDLYLVFFRPFRLNFYVLFLFHFLKSFLTKYITDSSILINDLMILPCGRLTIKKKVTIIDQKENKCFHSVFGLPYNSRNPKVI